jgi:hypothetical protein
MTPHWLLLEKLVADLGGVCASHCEIRAAAEAGSATANGANDAVDHATQAVTAALRDSVDDDSVVRTAWAAIARAQDAVRRLQTTMDRSRALCEEALTLQDQSLRLRRAPASPPSGNLSFGGPRRHRP